MVNRDLICIVLFGFIKRIKVEGYDGGQKRDRIICLQRIDARDPRYIIIWSIEFRFGT